MGQYHQFDVPPVRRPSSSNLSNCWNVELPGRRTTRNPNFRGGIGHWREILEEKLYQKSHLCLVRPPHAITFIFQIIYKSLIFLCHKLVLHCVTHSLYLRYVPTRDIQTGSESTCVSHFVKFWDLISLTLPILH